MRMRVLTPYRTRLSSPCRPEQPLACVQRQGLLPRDREPSRPPTDRLSVQDAEPHVPGLLRPRTASAPLPTRTREPVGRPAAASSSTVRRSGERLARAGDSESASAWTTGPAAERRVADPGAKQQPRRPPIARVAGDSRAALLWRRWPGSLSPSREGSTQPCPDRAGPHCCFTQRKRASGSGRTRRSVLGTRRSLASMPAECRSPTKAPTIAVLAHGPLTAAAGQKRTRLDHCGPQMTPIVAERSSASASRAS
jgi:hypothetical protein